MRWTTRVGRELRGRSVTARLLTEYRVASLARTGVQPEFSLTAALARPGTLAVDVGASVGNYALALWKAVGPGGGVLALEPNPAVYSELVHSTWRTGVECQALAVSDGRGDAVLSVPRDGDGVQQGPLGSLEHDDAVADRLSVRTATLDQLIGARTVSVVKIDVEGHEAAVLRGGRHVIERDRPALVLEIEQRHLRGSTVADVAAPLFKLGYAAAALSPGGMIEWAAFDVDHDQLRHLGSDGSVLHDHRSAYVNNFVFWDPDDDRSDAIVAAARRS